MKGGPEMKAGPGRKLLWLGHTPFGWIKPPLHSSTIVTGQHHSDRHQRQARIAVATAGAVKIFSQGAPLAGAFIIGGR